MEDTGFTGEWITLDAQGRIDVPSNPNVGFIEGDGTGPDIWAAAGPVFDAAVLKAYSGKRKIHWFELLAGGKAVERTGIPLPEKTIDLIRKSMVALKGPLTTSVGTGIRSLNVTLRQYLDLYACIRPIKYFPGLPSPVRHPEKVNMTVFRENTEDVYAGFEWESGSEEANKLARFLKENFRVSLPAGSGIGIKSMSPAGTKRLVRRSIAYAIERGLPSVTLVHKGNIMKFTEGAFRKWGYELAQEEFGDRTVTEADVRLKFGGRTPEGKVLINERITDSMFQQVLLRPEEYSVIATSNLNGDYLSDALAAQVGGLGMAPGANIGDNAAVFEATHGTAPKYAGLDKVNPGSLILSGVMMLEHMGWTEAAVLIKEAIERTIRDKIVTYDLARQMRRAKEVKCSGFAQAIIEHMG
ncbi:MAG TPA: isocitrate dehydrogenase (NADP(+)) [Deltaproteobacteria bacterium]|jgi:isocitrate dehydrogenase|nr:isocitrate dehydrogenase (NADP(+)) [Deltaproteobacteria bacterium]